MQQPKEKTRLALQTCIPFTNGNSISVLKLEFVSSCQFTFLMTLTNKGGRLVIWTPTLISPMERIHRRIPSAGMMWRKEGKGKTPSGKEKRQLKRQGGGIQSGAGLCKWTRPCGIYLEEAIASLIIRIGWKGTTNFKSLCMQIFHRGRNNVVWASCFILLFPLAQRVMNNSCYLRSVRTM